MMSIRKNIYNWKADRPNAFYHLRGNKESQYTMDTEHQIREIALDFLGSHHFDLSSAGGQGNHLTYILKNGSVSYFIRLENSDPKDDYMLIESEIMRQVRKSGVCVPGIFKVDVSHRKTSFSYQIMDWIEYPDLSKVKKSGKLNLFTIAREIGKNIAKWQWVKTENFGLFSTKELINTGLLKGYHNTYKDYFYLNLKKHLEFLIEASFISLEESNKIEEVINEYAYLLEISDSCLVHKDLALWNLLGTPTEIKAVIDWGDAIAGDPTDDISLFACFYGEDVLSELLAGYQMERPLPDDFYPRFYLHFLRNMIVKAVIRVGGGYFEKDENFFLIDDDLKGSALEEFTRSRLHLAFQNLKNNVEALAI